MKDFEASTFNLSLEEWAKFVTEIKALTENRPYYLTSWLLPEGFTGISTCRRFQQYIEWNGPTSSETVPNRMKWYKIKWNGTKSNEMVSQKKMKCDHKIRYETTKNAMVSVLF